MMRRENRAGYTRDRRVGGGQKGGNEEKKRDE